MPVITGIWCFGFIINVINLYEYPESRSNMANCKTRILTTEPDFIIE